MRYEQYMAKRRHSEPVDLPDKRELQPQSLDILQTFSEKRELEEDVEVRNANYFRRDGLLLREEGTEILKQQIPFGLRTQ